MNNRIISPVKKKNKIYLNTNMLSVSDNLSYENKMYLNLIFVLYL